MLFVTRSVKLRVRTFQSALLLGSARAEVSNKAMTYSDNISVVRRSNDPTNVATFK